MLRKLLLAGAGAIALLIIVFSGLLTGGLLLNQLPLTQPPGLAARLETYFNHNVAELKPDSVFPELQAPTYALPPQELFSRLQSTMQGLGWQITQVNPAQGTMQAVVTTPLWRFKDDVTIQVQPLSSGETALYARSASRVGEGDLGANAHHLLDLIQAVSQALEISQPG